jgi:hypothetical protein
MHDDGQNKGRLFIDLSDPKIPEKMNTVQCRCDQVKHCNSLCQNEQYDIVAKYVSHVPEYGGRWWFLCLPELREECPLSSEAGNLGRGLQINGKSVYSARNVLK